MNGRSSQRDDKAKCSVHKGMPAEEERENTQKFLPLRRALSKSIRCDKGLEPRNMSRRATKGFPISHRDKGELNWEPTGNEWGCGGSSRNSKDYWHEDVLWGNTK